MLGLYRSMANIGPLVSLDAISQLGPLGEMSRFGIADLNSAGRKPARGQLRTSFDWNESCFSKIYRTKNNNFDFKHVHVTHKNAQAKFRTSKNLKIDVENVGTRQ